MKRAAFEAMVRTLAHDIPESYLDGVVAIDVSPRTVPHASRADVFTLGECVPVQGDGEETTSRVVLYHGSFAALAANIDDFDWQLEAWETLTHELRHHLEWRAHTEALEDYDWAAEQNFARQAGEPFDPVFHRSGERVADDAWRVDDDVFIDRIVRRLPEAIRFTWRGRAWTVAMPPGSLPLWLEVDGLAVPPAGQLIVVVRRRAGLRDLFRRVPPPRMDSAVAHRGGTG